MTRRAPALETIEAFVVATQCRSFREAAARLSLSASAFSRRIQKLESFVGMPLLARSPGALELTEAGKEYLAEIEPAMRVIRLATSRLRSIRRHRKLRLMVSQSFATGWLVRRLPDLYSQGGPEVELIVGRDLGLLRAGQADVAVLGGDHELRGLAAEPLIEMLGMVVAGPTLVDQRAPPACLEELVDHRLLAVTSPADTWERWFSRAGKPGFSFPRPERFETLLLLYEAAASGLGVALAIPIIADSHLREGRLRPCFPGCLPLGTGYSVFYADDVVKRRADVQQLTGWLREQLRKSELEFLDCAQAASGNLRPRPAVLNDESGQRPAFARDIRKTVHAS